VSVKDRAVLVPMTSLELCTDRMLDFIGPDKPSSFCHYYVELHLPASCDAFTFGGRMRPRAKTSSQEQGPNFDIVGTCEWLSYVRASGSQAYGVSVRFFPCRVYINWWIRGVGYGYIQDYNIIICNCLPLTLTWVNILLIYTCSSL
jgi:hypothetical protein